MPALIGLLEGRPVAGWYEEVVERHEFDGGYGEMRSFEGVLAGSIWPAISVEDLRLEILGLGTLTVALTELRIFRSIVHSAFLSTVRPDRWNAIDPDILRLPVSEVLRDAGMDDAADKVLRIAAMLGVDVGGRSS